MPSKPDGNRAPDATRAAGDEGDFSFEIGIRRAQAISSLISSPLTSVMRMFRPAWKYVSSL